MNDRAIYQLQAELCNAMSHPLRQELLHVLFEGPKYVGELAKLTNSCQSTVSRHLAVLKQSGILTTERRGQEILYSVINPKIAEVCGLMRKVLAEQMEERSHVIQAMK